MSVLTLEGCSTDTQFYRSDAHHTITGLNEFVGPSTTNPSSRSRLRSQTQLIGFPREPDIIRDGDAAHSTDQRRSPREQTHADLKEAVIASYQHYGLDIELMFSYTPDNFHPRMINMRSSSKNKSLLTAAVMKMLKREALDILAFLPSSSDRRPVEQDIAVLKNILHGIGYPANRDSLQMLITSLHLKSKSSRDEARLAKFECYSILAVLRLQDISQVTIYSQPINDPG